MKLKWKISNISIPEFIWQNNLEKRTFILTQFEDVQHPWAILIDAIWDNASLLQDVRDWDYVEVCFNLKVVYSEDRDKHFNNISMRRIKNLDEPVQEEDVPF